MLRIRQAFLVPSSMSSQVKIWIWCNMRTELGKKCLILGKRSTITPTWQLCQMCQIPSSLIIAIYRIDYGKQDMPNDKLLLFLRINCIGFELNVCRKYFWRSCFFKHAHRKNRQTLKNIFKKLSFTVCLLDVIKCFEHKSTVNLIKSDKQQPLVCAPGGRTTN